MARKRKGKDAGLAKSPEFMAFEEAAKAILKVPKREIDKRLMEDRKAKTANGAA